MEFIHPDFLLTAMPKDLQSKGAASGNGKAIADELVYGGI